MHDLLILFDPRMRLFAYPFPVVVPVDQEEHGNAVECGPAELSHPQASDLVGHLEREKVGKGQPEAVIGNNRDQGRMTLHGEASHGATGHCFIPIQQVIHTVEVQHLGHLCLEVRDRGEKGGYMVAEQEDHAC